MKRFRDYQPEERRNYITLSTGEYYPDILVDACKLYGPVIEVFSQILKKSESSSALFMNISKLPNEWLRIQLCRIFRKYVSPETPVEMLKKAKRAPQTCNEFKKTFRPINIVQKNFDERPIPDEALCALLWEYKNRGKKGYDLTEKFFNIINNKFPELLIWGPKRAGADIQAPTIFPNYPHDSRPLDFIISSKDKATIYAVGFARYDGDRGGSQEDDRTGGYKNGSDELLNYFHSNNLNIKIIFLNDGPGLLLGSMWEDYSKIEERHQNEVMVMTLRMIDERLTDEWLRGKHYVGRR